jgi:hypothetical protein
MKEDWPQPQEQLKGQEGPKLLLLVPKPHGAPMGEAVVLWWW